MMTPYQRVSMALRCGVPDRVPVLLLLPLHGAGEVGLPVGEFLRQPSAMAEGQARLLARFGHDCVYGFSYGAAEAEAFGAGVEFFDDAPPDLAALPRLGQEALARLEPPEPARCPSLARTLELIRLLAGRFKGRVPILANVIAPLGLPIMLLGMEAWLELLLLGDPALRDRLLEVCEIFCSRWARAQIAAGADAVFYFDPMSSTEMTTTAQFRELALPRLRAVAGRLEAPLIFCTAGGRSAAIVDQLAAAGARAVLAGSAEELRALKRAVSGKLALAGNLNNIALSAWTPAEAEHQVRRCLEAAAPGGGYLLCDQHGEIPSSTPPEVLHAVVQTAACWQGA